MSSHTTYTESIWNANIVGITRICSDYNTDFNEPTNASFSFSEFCYGIIKSEIRCMYKSTAHLLSCNDGVSYVVKVEHKPIDTNFNHEEFY